MRLITIITYMAKWLMEKKLILLLLIMMMVHTHCHVLTDDDDNSEEESDDFTVGKTRDTVAPKEDQEEDPKWVSSLISSQESKPSNSSQNSFDILSRGINSWSSPNGERRNRRIKAQPPDDRPENFQQSLGIDDDRNWETKSDQQHNGELAIHLENEALSTQLAAIEEEDNSMKSLMNKKGRPVQHTLPNDVLDKMVSNAFDESISREREKDEAYMKEHHFSNRHEIRPDELEDDHLAQEYYGTDSYDHHKSEQLRRKPSKKLKPQPYKFKPEAYKEQDSSKREDLLRTVEDSVEKTRKGNSRYSPNYRNYNSRSSKLRKSDSRHSRTKKPAYIKRTSRRKSPQNTRVSESAIETNNLNKNASLDGIRKMFFHTKPNEISNLVKDKMNRSNVTQDISNEKLKNSKLIDNFVHFVNGIAKEHKNNSLDAESSDDLPHTKMAKTTHEVVTHDVRVTVTNEDQDPVKISNESIADSKDTVSLLQTNQIKTNFARNTVNVSSPERYEIKATSNIIPKSGTETVSLRHKQLDVLRNAFIKQAKNLGKGNRTFVSSGNSFKRFDLPGSVALRNSFNMRDILLAYSTLDPHEKNQFLLRVNEDRSKKNSSELLPADDTKPQINGTNGLSSWPGRKYSGLHPQLTSSLSGDASNDGAKKNKVGELPEGLTGAMSYTNRDGREFLFAVGTETLTFSEARTKCKSHGGDLTSIGDKEEHEFVTMNVVPEPGNYWIGFTDQAIEGTWEWADGTPVRFSNWSNMEPDDGNMKSGEAAHNEDCAILKSTMDWSDVPCWSKYKYICKLYPNGVRSPSVSFGGPLSEAEVEQERLHHNKTGDEWGIAPALGGGGGWMGSKNGGPSVAEKIEGGKGIKNSPDPAGLGSQNIQPNQIMQAQPPVVQQQFSPMPVPHIAPPMAQVQHEIQLPPVNQYQQPNILPSNQHTAEMATVPMLHTAPQLQNIQTYVPGPVPQPPLPYKPLPLTSEGDLKLKAGAFTYSDSSTLSYPEASSFHTRTDMGQQSPNTDANAMHVNHNSADYIFNSLSDSAKKEYERKSEFVQSLKNVFNARYREREKGPMFGRDDYLSFVKDPDGTNRILRSQEVNPSSRRLNSTLNIESRTNKPKAPIAPLMGFKPNKAKVIAGGNGAPSVQDAPPVNSTDEPIDNKHASNGQSIPAEQFPPHMKTSLGPEKTSSLAPVSYDGSAPLLNLQAQPQQMIQPVGTLMSGALNPVPPQAPNVNGLLINTHGGTLTGVEPPSGPTGSGNNGIGIDQSLKPLPKVVSSPAETQSNSHIDIAKIPLLNHAHGKYDRMVEALLSASKLANRIVPELLKDYSEKFSPDIDVVKDVCGKMCGDTVSNLQVGDPEQIGTVCGRLCAHSLLKMNPQEVLSLLHELGHHEQMHNLHPELNHIGEVMPGAHPEVAVPCNPSQVPYNPVIHNPMCHGASQPPSPQGNPAQAAPNPLPLQPQPVVSPPPAPETTADKIVDAKLSSAASEFTQALNNFMKSVKPDTNLAIEQAPPVAHPLGYQVAASHAAMDGLPMIEYGAPHVSYGFGGTIGNSIRNTYGLHHEPPFTSPTRRWTGAGDFISPITVHSLLGHEPPQYRHTMHHRYIQPRLAFGRGVQEIPHIPMHPYYRNPGASYRESSMIMPTPDIGRFAGISHLAFHTPESLQFDDGPLYDKRTSSSRHMPLPEIKSNTHRWSNAYRHRPNSINEAAVPALAPKISFFDHRQDAEESIASLHQKAIPNNSPKSSLLSFYPRQRNHVLLVNNIIAHHHNPSMEYTETGMKRGLLGGEVKPKKKKQVRLTIRSSGCFDPPYHGVNCEDTVASIEVNGVEVSPNRQGFNFAVIDYKTGQVDRAASFNTHGDSGAYSKLEKFIKELPPWKIVCVAVKEDGKNYLPSTAAQSLKKLGATDIVTADVEYRAAYALVGLSGPPEIVEKVQWKREELSKAGKGPSVISVVVDLDALYDKSRPPPGLHVPVSSFETLTSDGAGGGGDKSEAEGGNDAMTEMSPGMVGSIAATSHQNDGEAAGGNSGASSSVGDVGAVPSVGGPSVSLGAKENEEKKPEPKEENKPASESKSSSESKASTSAETDKTAQQTDHQSTANQGLQQTQSKGDQGMSNGFGPGGEGLVGSNPGNAASSALSQAGPTSGVNAKDINKLVALADALGYGRDKAMAGMSDPGAINKLIALADAVGVSKPPTSPNQQSGTPQTNGVQKTLNSVPNVSSSLPSNPSTNGAPPSSVAAPSVKDSQMPPSGEFSALELQAMSKLMERMGLKGNPISQLQNQISAGGNLAANAQPPSGNPITSSTMQMSSNPMFQPGSLPAPSFVQQSNPSAVVSPQIGASVQPPWPILQGMASPGGITGEGRQLQESSMQRASAQQYYPGSVAIQPGSVDSPAVPHSVAPAPIPETAPLTASATQPAPLPATDTSVSAATPTAAVIAAAAAQSAEVSEEPINKEVGEAQLASALSTLGIPDKGADGIASLIASAVTDQLSSDSGDRSQTASLMESVQKLGLAAKLAKSIADLGGRGAASAAGIASLAELIKTNPSASIASVIEKIGQGLQRVGGAGAAVGYAALASALKDVTKSQTAGTMVANLILSLAEEGSAPGTAGLAALAAGLGGSGADALAGGLGGSLPSSQSGSARDGEEGPATPTDSAAPASSPARIIDSKLIPTGGELEVHKVSTDSEYTGKGPIGSRSQGGYADVGIGNGGSISVIPGKKDSAINIVSSSTPETGIASLGSAITHSAAASGLSESALSTLCQSSLKKSSIECQHVTPPRAVAPSQCGSKCDDKSKIVAAFVELESSDTTATIKFNGRDVSRDRPGFNVAILDFSKGRIDSSESFDTESDPEASKAFLNFIRGLRDGKVVMVSTKGDASQHADDSLYGALDSIGGHTLPRSHMKPKDKYVLLGFKGITMDWGRDKVASDPGTTAALSQPLMVGPAALKDRDFCIRVCHETEAMEASNSHSESQFAKESSYADIGSDPKPDSAASVGMKRDRATNHHGKKKTKKSLKSKKKPSSQSSEDKSKQDSDLKFLDFLSSKADKDSTKVPELNQSTANKVGSNLSSSGHNENGTTAQDTSALLSQLSSPDQVAPTETTNDKTASAQTPNQIQLMHDGKPESAQLVTVNNLLSSGVLKSMQKLKPTKSVKQKIILINPTLKKDKNAVSLSAIFNANSALHKVPRHNYEKSYSEIGDNLYSRSERPRPVHANETNESRPARSRIPHKKIRQHHLP